MQSSQLGDVFRMTRCSPDFVTLGNERSRNGQPDAGTGSGQKNAFRREGALSQLFGLWLWCVDLPANELGADEFDLDVGIYVLDNRKIT